MALRGISSATADILLDCGASAHMFCDQGHFHSYTANEGNETISVGDARDVPIAGTGSVEMQCRLPDEIRTVILHGVLHVPKLAANLVSLGTLQRAGAKHHSHKEGIIVTLGADELFRASFPTSTATLYYINLVQREAAFAIVASGSMRVWHRRLGHLHLDAIRAMVQKKLVSRLDITSSKEYNHVCEGCVLGKSHCLPFPKTSSTIYSKMELVVMDITGPMSVETWTGHAYAMVVIEASCRFRVGQLLAKKEEVASTLKDVVTMLERQSGLKLKKMRSDNGTEFVNSIVESFCQRNGILHETIVPYAPEQNGIAERSIKTYFEMVRCMLHSAKMDLWYWGEAFMYAVHIRNLLPTSALRDTIQIHAWSGCKPDISHLHIFGSTAYANIPKKVRGGKLEATSIKCCLLGWWADETKGYRLEEAKTGKLITAQDV